MRTVEKKKKKKWIEIKKLTKQFRAIIASLIASYINNTHTHSPLFTLLFSFFFF